MRVCFLCGFVLVFGVFVILVGGMGCKFTGKRAVDVVDTALESDCLSPPEGFEGIEWDGTPYIDELEDRLIFRGESKEGQIIHDSRTVVGMNGGVEQTVAAFVLLDVDLPGDVVGVARVWHPDLAGKVGRSSVVDLYPLPENYVVEGSKFSVAVDLPAEILALDGLYVSVVEQLPLSNIDDPVIRESANFIGMSCIVRK